MSVDPVSLLNDRFDRFLYTVYHSDRTLYDRIYDVFTGTADPTIHLYHVLEKHYEFQYSEEPYGGYFFRRNAHKIDFANTDLSSLVHEHLGAQRVNYILDLFASLNLVATVETIQKSVTRLKEKSKSQ